MSLADLNCNFNCDWLIELSDNRLSNNQLSNKKLSDNHLGSELVENRTFSNQSQSKEIPLTNRVRGPYSKLQTEFLPPRFMAQVRSARAINRSGKTRIRNLQYGPRKRG